MRFKEDISIPSMHGTGQFAPYQRDVIEGQEAKNYCSQLTWHTPVGVATWNGK